MGKEHNHYFQNTVRVGCSHNPTVSIQLHVYQFPATYSKFQSLWNRTLDFLMTESLNYPSHHYNITVIITNIIH